MECLFYANSCVPKYGVIVPGKDLRPIGEPPYYDPRHPDRAPPLFPDRSKVPSKEESVDDVANRFGEDSDTNSNDNLTENSSINSSINSFINSANNSANNSSYNSSNDNYNYEGRYTVIILTGPTDRSAAEETVPKNSNDPKISDDDSNNVPKLS